MHVIEIFLPLRRNDGSPQPKRLFAELRGELVSTFGGLTAHSRAPAEGLWKGGHGDLEQDSIVIFEVVADDLEHSWWRNLRQRLEHMFEQEDILIRASKVERL